METWRPLDGRVALITGGSRGIGAAITRKLASWGATVAIGYVDHSREAKGILADLKRDGVESSLHQADLSDPDDVKNLIQEVGDLYGRINILVHNAAATKFVELKDASLEQWQFVQDTNSRATWLLSSHALGLMRGQEGARFITITNSTTTRIIERAGLFAAAKAGVEALTKYLSFELAPYGIVANCVRPGLVQTGVMKVRPDFAYGVDHERNVTPWLNGRITTAESSADAVAILCLPEASWIAGQTITVDGGYRLWGMLPRRSRGR
ncbi:SDR family oxidoreductase [uncultured Propionibacterium sp.]|uniref:SDR family NAD(P)-dependent oxidoreductase n=1 Tax=uncultured Propionibacterium sp. TaxID=218066 RepID=UPI00292EF93C|nr:SDR family oxidoreductase [uncultured Propionibacterium sp.]